MATIRKGGEKYQAQVRRLGCPGISKTFYQLKDAQTKAFLTKVDTGFVKKKCDNEGLERGFDSIKT